MNRAGILKMKTLKDKHGNLFSSFLLYVPLTTSNEKWTFKEERKANAHVNSVAMFNLWKSLRFIDSHKVVTLVTTLIIVVAITTIAHWCEPAFLTLRTKFLNDVMIRCSAVHEFLDCHRQKCCQIICEIWTAFKHNPIVVTNLSKSLK